MKSRLKLIYTALVLTGCAMVVVFVASKVSQRKNDFDRDMATDIDEERSVPPPTPISPNDIADQPRDSSALGGYDVLIADRGNNRVLEVTPDKQIVWEYHFDVPKAGLGADDAFFTDGGKRVIVNLEEYQLIEIIDYQTKQVVWKYGVAGRSGSRAGLLNTPDDAYRLQNGDVTVADIKNCRVIEIAPDGRIVHEYGHIKQCKTKLGYLNKPNGDTPLPNGHMFISNIVGHNLVELNEKWQPVFSMNLPVRYPSDPQATKAGNILIADYSKPGKIVEVSRQGVVLWQYEGEGMLKLNKPSLAVELPNGNILVNDDFNHRVIVIDKTSKEIVWQYGVSGKPGIGAGQLNIPDGVDIIARTPDEIREMLQTVAAVSPPPETLPLYTIGKVTWHANDFVKKTIRVQGYLLKKENGYDIFSDEPTGGITSHDLPVFDPTMSAVEFKKKYILEGVFLDHGLQSSNHNAYHLELSKRPEGQFP